MDIVERLRFPCRGEERRRENREAADEIEKLRGEVADLDAELWAVKVELSDMKAERDAAVKDAERYRWLKANSILGIAQFGVSWSLTVRDGVAPDAVTEIDAAIDAARGEM
jgi:hypothetical protein